MNEQAKHAKTLTGCVKSDKMDKTIVVLIERKIKHPLYKKYVRRLTKVLAHDEHNECKEGDMVIIEASRPIAKNKAWRLCSIIRKAGQGVEGQGVEGLST